MKFFLESKSIKLLLVLMLLLGTLTFMPQGVSKSMASNVSIQEEIVEVKESAITLGQLVKAFMDMIFDVVVTFTCPATETLGCTRYCKRVNPKDEICGLNDECSDGLTKKCILSLLDYDESQICTDVNCVSLGITERAACLAVTQTAYIGAASGAESTSCFPLETGRYTKYIGNDLLGYGGTPTLMSNWSIDFIGWIYNKAYNFPAAAIGEAVLQNDEVPTLSDAKPGDIVEYVVGSNTHYCILASVNHQIPDTSMLVCGDFYSPTTQSDSKSTGIVEYMSISRFRDRAGINYNRIIDASSMKTHMMR